MIRMAQAAAILLSITACSPGGSATVGAEVIRGGTKVFPDAGDPNMITVNLLNTHDIGYDLENKQDRTTFIMALLTPQCGQPRITDERVTVLGGIVRTWKTYTVRAYCPNGASSPAT